MQLNNKDTMNVKKLIHVFVQQSYNEMTVVNVCVFID